MGGGGRSWHARSVITRILIVHAVGPDGRLVTRYVFVTSIESHVATGVTAKTAAAQLLACHPQ